MKNDKKNVISNDRIEELESRLKECNEKYLRALADYQNLEKQTTTWKEEFTKYANVGLIRRQLEVLDDLEKAQEHLQDEGLKLIIEKLKNILAEEGLEEIELEGKAYNPSQAECVGTQPGEIENAIVQVLQKGYKIGERIVRPAKVIVSVSNKETRNNDQSNGQEPNLNF